MYKSLKADKDAYITNRVVSGQRVVTGNVGLAGSLDLFKLYGITSTGSLPNTELSRLLIHFNLDPVRERVTAGKIDTRSPSFKCFLKLFDVYGGQTTPSNFSVNVAPLSRSFDEGLGRDVVYYADNDTCNFLTGSRAQGPWIMSGCALGGDAATTVDYITSSAGTSLVSTQLFETGEENLLVDVTSAISATLAGVVPDQGFRIALADAHETDLRSYFVKRFAGRGAFNEEKHPQLIVKFDDSRLDDSLSLRLGSPATLFLYNRMNGVNANLVSGSTSITGSNSLMLKLVTEISGGTHVIQFSGSQHQIWLTPQTGIYSSSFTLPANDQVLLQKLAQSGSIKLTPVWGSLDGTVTFLSGSPLIAKGPEVGSSTGLARLDISVHNVQDDHLTTEEPIFRVHVTDPNAPFSRLPVQDPGLGIRDMHYQVRDVASGRLTVPVDTTGNSTRMSSDNLGMFFNVDMSNLTSGHSYVIDVFVVRNGTTQVHKAASPVFRVVDTL